MKHLSSIARWAGLWLVAWALPLAAQTNSGLPKPHDYAKWEKEIVHLERAAISNPPPANGIVFIGSSTIARWKTLEADFAGLPVVNRGFGGSEIRDSTFYAPRILYPLQPKVVVLRAGGNDLAAGRSVSEVCQDIQDFCEAVHAQLPAAQICYLSWSATPTRWAQHDKETAMNDFAKKYLADKPYGHYLDASDVPLDADGHPRKELFVADGIHFNADGYKLLTAKVRPQLPIP